MFTRRGPRGDSEEPSEVSKERRAFLRSPSSWPGGFEGFELRWGAGDEPDVTEELAQSLEAELKREVGRGHPLFEREVVAIAKRETTDDVLFTLPGSDAVAVVHLTWVGRAETPPWPSTNVYASFNDFLAAAADDFGA